MGWPSGVTMTPGSRRRETGKDSSLWRSGVGTPLHVCQRVTSLREEGETFAGVCRVSIDCELNKHPYVVRYRRFYQWTYGSIDWVVEGKRVDLEVSFSKKP